ncbi:class I SAM-dependent methyltransferase [Rubripirellula reticaptiva]|uniref:Methyltransferase type 11 domain-containing protein n=2 Tax=Rubripirellula reticaptiva TaxID=2528013 RepID=A0A5C6F607_9BACT|nr:class I SAM-dependent methyltransferase [Rubripirellula reticaptiva]TWU55990.1 hypothetical protein Poly59_22930 [Rubripirellula reticaptiva]
MPVVARTKSIVSAIKFNWQVQSLPDRVYLRQVMLPAMARMKPANVLLAGTRRYTKRYPELFDREMTAVWTIDFDPSAARFGNGQLHRTGDMCEVDKVFRGVRFDMIHINGLLGFGVDTPEGVRAMITACHRALQPGGHLMLGWDADRTRDPSHNKDITSLFEHTGFIDAPERHEVPGVDGYDHVFDWFWRRDTTHAGSSECPSMGLLR